jgi:ABC-type glycerol-3-phosphate transport system substrate-binding protein
VLKTNAPDTSGDWGMIPGPASYRWGGTWIGAWKNTKNPDAAKELIRYLTTDDDFLERYAKDSGDLIDNLAVVDKIKDSYSEPFLDGQNHYAEFAQMAKGVDGKLTQGSDQAIEGLFNEAVTASKSRPWRISGPRLKPSLIIRFVRELPFTDGSP